MLTDVIVYLGAAVLFVPVASRFKLGSVLGYLAAGCAIGPSGLGLVRDVGSILHFAEFGVVLMLFLIGLELDPAASGRCAGASSEAAACRWPCAERSSRAGPWSRALPWRGALIAGLAVALSSTAIAVQTMRERGLLGSPMGKVAFGILLFQDVAAIPLVAVVPLLAPRAARATGFPWLGLAKVAGAIAGVVVVGRFATQPVLRAIAKTNLREVFTAFALLLVIGIAHLMQLAGISMALGAFLAGVLLASCEYRHALETDIEPFKGLLMGLFFIAVGMSIDFGLLSTQPLFLVALVLGFVALKTVTLALIARAAGGSAGGAAMFAALLSQGGEFAFVVFGVARAAHVLPGDWDKLLTLAVALSMALTPVLVIGAEGLQRRLFPPARARPTPSRQRTRPSSSPASGGSGKSSGASSSRAGSRPRSSTSIRTQIELFRRFGFRMFYGDATRLDLLHAAGAEHAKVIVNAIDDVEANLRLVDIVQQHFPHLAIVARARNVAHLYELRQRGVTLIDREIFDSALMAGRRALEASACTPTRRTNAPSASAHNLDLLENLGSEALDEQSAQRASARGVKSSSGSSRWTARRSSASKAATGSERR